MKALFGTAVCADAAVGKCDLIPEAQAWMDQMNQEMAGGHCFGFSVAADLVWQNKINTSAFGAPTINGLAIDNNASLQSTIAEGWVYQTLDSVQAKKITGSPNQILDELEKVLKPHPSDSYTIAIWKRDGTGGHAVTPYEVKYNGNGQYQVLIYDNNWPGQTRAIAFDTNKDTWSYDAAANPSDPTEQYEGDANTKTLVLFPTSPGRGTQPCPFCGTVPGQGSTAGTTGAARTAEIYLTGSVTNHSHVLITDQAGRRLGLRQREAGQRDPRRPLRAAHLGSGLEEQAGADPLRTGQRRLHHHPRRHPPHCPRHRKHRHHRPQLAHRHQQHPHAPRRQGHPDGRPQRHQADLPHHSRPVPHHPGRGVGHPGPLRLRHRRRLQPTGQHHQPERPARRWQPDHHQRRLHRGIERDLQMTRSTEQGVQHFSHDAIPLAGGDTADLQFGNWTNPSQGIPLVTTHNGQQTTQTLTNQ